ncbi:MAG: 16S rRNA (guanine(966)-N(2))-methyltransferase RsmD [Chloroflexi bacterium]|nr:16S rRNA (guanine(966)-N(2))-methyltransferase RsmD [Chloroflexota bacterium]
MALRVAGGQVKGHPLRTAKGVALRPTSERVREAIFSSLGERVQGARVLDLFAGSGALGIEALSRGASWADFVEADPRLATALRANLAELGFSDRSHVYCARVSTMLASLPGPYSIVLLDPPYSLPSLDTLLGDMGSAPMLSPGGVLVLEHSRHRIVQETYGALRLGRSRRYGDSCISLYQGEGELCLLRSTLAALTP